MNKSGSSVTICELSLQHILPATHIASFSEDSTTMPRRKRVVWVADLTGQKLRQSSCEAVGWERKVYSAELDRVWNGIESELARAIDLLLTNQLDMLTWLRTLVPFVATVLVRSHDFVPRFRRRLQTDSEILKAAVESNSDGARMIEIQRLLASILVADWHVLESAPGESIILSDIGYSPFVSPFASSVGIAIPIGRNHILGILPREDRLIGCEDGSFWKPDIKYFNLDPRNFEGLNSSLAQSAHRLIFGPTKESLEPYMDVTRQPLAIPDPQQMGFNVHRSNEFMWHMIVCFLTNGLADSNSGAIDLNFETLASGWCPPIIFPTNLPIMFGEIVCTNHKLAARLTRKNAASHGWAG